MIASFTIPFFLPKDIEKIYTETEKKELILIENDTFLLYRNNSYHFKTKTDSEQIIRNNVSVIIIESLGCENPFVEIKYEKYHYDIWEYETKPIIKQCVFYIPINSYINEEIY